MKKLPLEPIVDILQRVADEAEDGIDPAMLVLFAAEIADYAEAALSAPAPQTGGEE